MGIRGRKRLSTMASYAAIVSTVITIVGFVSEPRGGATGKMGDWESIVSIVTATVPRWVPLSLSLFFLAMFFKWRREILRIQTEERWAREKEQKAKEVEEKERRRKQIVMWRRTVTAAVSRCDQLNHLDGAWTTPEFQATRLKAIVENYEGFKSLRRYLDNWDKLLDSSSWNPSEMHPRERYMLDTIDRLEKEWGLV